MEGCRVTGRIGLFTDVGIEHSMTGRTALRSRVAAPWLPAMVAALLSVSLGVVLALGLAAELSPSAPSAVRSAGAPRGGLSSLPAAARGPVSAALGSADPRYRVSAFRGGFEAVNPGQRLHVRFERSGVLLSSGAARVGLSLDGVGYGGSLRAAGDVLSGVAANRVVYTGGGLSEWYANGPLGLEQGFTVTRAPVGRPSGPLTLSMALSGDVHATLVPGGGGVVLSRGGSSLRYGALAASDAQGRTLPSRLVLHAGRILLLVDTRGARYPLRIDPTFAQQGKLADVMEDGGKEEEQGEGRLGASVALSADGDTALIGAPGDDDGAGAAWVFTRSGATWTQQGSKLIGGEAGDTGAAECEIEEPGEEEGEEAGECGFGKSVALSADGATALVGGPGADGNLGAVWVLTREGTSWTRQASLTGGVEERPKGHFGRSVALSTDGDTALIGAPGDAGYTGAAWVFTRSGSEWIQQGPKLTPGGEGSHEIYFGKSVALSGDGDTALIGAPGDAERAGAAWVFAFDEQDMTWTQPGSRLTDSGESGEGRFGYSVALSADASTALVGAPGDAGRAGAAWAYAGSGSEWIQQGLKLTAGGASGEAEFGYGVALSADGGTALIGGPRYDNSSGHAGAAWVFARAGSSTLSLEQTLTTPKEHGRGRGRFGAAVALSAGGEAALLGAPNDSTKVGAALSFAVAQPPPGGGGEGGGETKPPKKNGGGKEPESQVTGGSGTGGGGAGNGAVLAFGPTTSSTCGVSLIGRRITVRGRRRAALKLARKGSAGSVLACRGRVTLEVKVKAKAKVSRKRRTETKTIGTAGFSIAPGKSKVVTIKLNASGRALLAAGHGRLGASLVILRVSPGPARVYPIVISGRT